MLLLEQEIWKPVPGYPGVMASSLGRTSIPPTTRVSPNGRNWTYQKPASYGTLGEGGGQIRYVRKIGPRTVKVAKLICLAFRGAKPFPEAVVMHLDENALNNRADNLMWGSQKQNLNAPGFLAHCRGRTGEKNPRVKGMRKLTSTTIEEELHGKT